MICQSFVRTNVWSLWWHYDHTLYVTMIAPKWSQDYPTLFAISAIFLSWSTNCLPLLEFGSCPCVICMSGNTCASKSSACPDWTSFWTLSLCQLLLFRKWQFGVILEYICEQATKSIYITANRICHSLKLCSLWVAWLCIPCSYLTGRGQLWWNTEYTSICQ